MFMNFKIRLKSLILNIYYRLLLPIPYQESFEKKVIIYRGGLHDCSTTTIEEVFKATIMLSDILVEEEEQISITGMHQIIDLNGVLPSHGLQMTPTVAKKSMILMQVGIVVI